MNRESSAWDVNVTIEILTGMDDGALEGLENAYLTEIGEAPLSEDARARLSDAIRAGRIVFVVARVRNRAIGMCSVTRCFSTFACADIGIFEDFFVEPNFRKRRRESARVRRTGMVRNQINRTAPTSSIWKVGATRFEKIRRGAR